ncbi:MAG: Peptidase M23 family protein [Candidatus Kaiserbacteria bacterium GW2011_GWB1_52_6]|uniref:Peptidase M23 family protein n=3 Tax=Candidatus Kaiseribacteriota TaxID=1752734 RepID=A0A0G1XGH8_9BACT|nr:MAG: Peptidase M23 family protein [Candidatus Kaiserbacteria bacterium GW2011_GWA2_52_12]KKW27617.1 MAG: Peptidase M23 family protein [Candidatus Kaiserbacteria bacterium GW2011_GWB1_52_6]KKW30051.1 MAG: Peptidase M23 family protein [Candidatus Kaiserbacteria bacterium GW2011_GWC2_52_8b]
MRLQGKKYASSRIARMAAISISLLIVLGSLLPAAARAAVFDSFLGSLLQRTNGADVPISQGNLQTMPFLRPAMNIDPAPARGGGDITIVDSSALVPDEGPSGTLADIEKPKNGTISVYVVRPGDTLSGIAKMFGVTASTILWANDLPSSSRIQIGQTLTILPVTGIKYTVKKGDTLASIAKKYGGDAAEISSFNGLSGTLTVGNEIIIPDGEIAAPAPTFRGSAEPAHNVGPAGTPEQIGYYLRPVVGGRRTQGIHGYNGVDLGGLPIGTPIMASAEGDVIIAKEGGWNGGYGNYAVIQHNNGSQTLYSHESRVIVSVGQHVMQGQVIGYVGSTGKSTGPHVHFEIRNGIRNPF